ncbi:cyclin-dependent kinase 6-like isoform X3 [Hypanus sabinus]|uniref:cyclin-dependent kinase 6-like isoform X3 n=1 Tax=Hypanus sabinus TaxID=79690 RepID=UPI0028C48CB9|nr:cyclin-dependent kinase 6-like isoform X3 [Hypanus sabinus]
MENSKPVRYELLAEIGEGTYGKVYKARDLESNGKCVALKRIAIPRTPEGIPVNVIREVALLKHLELFDHPNIIRLFDVELVHQTDRTMKMTLVFELIEQDLAVFLSKVREPGLLQNKVKGLVHQLFRGLDFLHSNSVVHRDLKPENILVSNSGQVKLADFGLARMYTVNMALTPVCAFGPIEQSGFLLSPREFGESSSGACSLEAKKPGDGTRAHDRLHFLTIKDGNQQAGVQRNLPASDRSLSLPLARC